ncbi:MAG: hypothetical protein J7L94_10360 [Caldisericaceae bacterium]|nr:hypothetical protein [Caldisericaceae bacterium]
MKLLFPLIVLAFTFSLYAQQQPQQQPANQPQVIDLGATEIKVKIETPQVQLITKRIKPEFDDIKLDRSFKKELIGEDEKINLKAPQESAEYLRIDIEKLMKTLR